MPNTNAWFVHNTHAENRRGVCVRCGWAILSARRDIYTISFFSFIVISTIVIHRLKSSTKNFKCTHTHISNDFEALSQYSMRYINIESGDEKKGYGFYTVIDQSYTVHGSHSEKTCALAHQIQYSMDKIRFGTTNAHTECTSRITKWTHAKIDKIIICTYLISKSEKSGVFSVRILIRKKMKIIWESNMYKQMAKLSHFFCCFPIKFITLGQIYIWIIDGNISLINRDRDTPQNTNDIHRWRRDDYNSNNGVASHLFWC